MKCELKFLCTARKEPCPYETGPWPCGHSKTLHINGPVTCHHPGAKLEAISEIHRSLINEVYPEVHDGE